MQLYKLYKELNLPLTVHSTKQCHPILAILIQQVAFFIALDRQNATYQTCTNLVMKSFIFPYLFSGKIKDFSGANTDDDKILADLDKFLLFIFTDPAKMEAFLNFAVNIEIKPIDIAVIGLGPGGAIAALELAYLGYKVNPITNRTSYTRPQIVGLAQPVIYHLFELVKHSARAVEALFKLYRHGRWKLEALYVNNKKASPDKEPYLFQIKDIERILFMALEDFPHVTITQIAKESHIKIHPKQITIEDANSNTSIPYTLLILAEGAQRKLAIDTLGKDIFSYQYESVDDAESWVSGRFNSDTALTLADAPKLPAMHSKSDFTMFGLVSKQKPGAEKKKYLAYSNQEGADKQFLQECVATLFDASSEAINEYHNADPIKQKLAYTKFTINPSFAKSIVHEFEESILVLHGDAAKVVSPATSLGFANFSYNAKFFIRASCNVNYTGESPSQHFQQLATNIRENTDIAPGFYSHTPPFSK